jgi:FKBP-type peptidyl-prolyl cis-trans isomerase SlyD
MKISDGMFVTVIYQMALESEEDGDEQIDDFSEEDVASFICGMNNLIPPFEKYLAGMEEGDEFSFRSEPKEAFGEYREEYVVDVPKTLFEIDGKFDSKHVYEGNMIPMRDSNGKLREGMVVNVGDDTVQIDFNHVLAGETILCKGRITDVHVASLEEIAAIATEISSDGCENCDGCEDCGDEAGGCSSGCGCGR